MEMYYRSFSIFFFIFFSFMLYVYVIGNTLWGKWNANKVVVVVVLNHRTIFC